MVVKLSYILNYIINSSSTHKTRKVKEIDNNKFIDLQVRRFKSVNKWSSKCNYLDSQLSNKMDDKFNVRWAFNAKMWKPTYGEVLAASSYIQKEERERISRFLFQDDAKSSLLGRLMLRKYVHLATSSPYQEICFDRDSCGKPYLVGDSTVSFNVSHQSDYVVLAGHPTHSIAIDVMKIEPPANKNIPEFFRLMTRQFSRDEWDMVKSFATETEQIASFYRHWCLKESYVKNTGVGLTIPLQEISFNIQTPNLKVGVFYTDTTLYERNELKENWLFEETLLDEKYAVAVSIDLKTCQVEHEPVPYTFLTFEELVKEAQPLHEPCASFSVDFMNKQNKHF